VITLRLAGYRTFEQKLYLAPGDTFELNHQMLRLRAGERDVLPPAPQAVPGDWAEPAREAGDQPASPFGILAVTAEPPDARIYVDGEAWAGPSGSREFVLHLPAGWHELEVRKDGYQPFATKLELQEGETTRLDVTLMP
jgi:hypothetical protein